MITVDTCATVLRISIVMNGGSQSAIKGVIISRRCWYEIVEIAVGMPSVQEPDINSGESTWQGIPFVVRNVKTDCIFFTSKHAFDHFKVL